MFLPNFNPPIVAHRGASAYAPENTIAAFTKAALLGVKWIEFDVMLSAAKEPVVIHDEQLNRTTNGWGRVYKYPYAYLRTLDAGAWFDPRFSGEIIPSLKSVIEFIANTNLAANIEIKAIPGYEEVTVAAVLREVTPFFPQPHPSILFSSFSMETLKYLRKQSPQCMIGMLLHEWDQDWRSLCESLQCASVHLNQKIMTPERALEIKNADKMLLTYTVNKPARAQALYAMGVDAVFSDAPDTILAAM